jgi:hypothetical protein
MRCTYIKQGGERCEAAASAERGLCWNHDPAHAAERKANARRGGRRGGRGRPLRELAALRTENADLRDRLLKGELDPRIAAVAGQLINTDCRLIDLTLKAKEQTVMEERLAEIEQALAVRKRGYTHNGA